MNFVEKQQEIVQYAKDNGLLFLVSELRYAMAGIPDEITDTHISFAEGTCIEVGSVGNLGGEPDEYEVNPFPKVVAQSAVCFVECIVPPKGWEEKMVEAKEKQRKRREAAQAA